MLKSFLTIVISAVFVCMLTGQIYTQLALDTTKSFTEIVEEAELYFDQSGRGPHSGYKAFKRWQYWMKRCLDSNGNMMIGPKHLNDFMEFQASQENSGYFSSEDVTWEELGPYSTENTTGWSSHIGRLTSISVDPHNPLHIIVGSPTGGVWKTLNEGETWAPIFDDQMITKVYSLAISPGNSSTYFVGTSGGGILRSQDGGLTWSVVVGVPKGTRIIDIKIDPADPMQIYAINEGGNIYTTKDGGDNWRSAFLSGQILYDLEFKPDDSSIIYASGINTLVRSVDSGLSWQVVPGPWHQNRLFNPLMMATTPDDPNYLYILEAQVGGFKALHLSVDGGQTWIQKSTDDNNDNNLLGYSKIFKGGQAPRDMDIVVSPSDKDEVHLGGIMSHRSLDGGKTWTQTSHWLISDPLPFIHADVDMIHYMGNNIYFITDGGLFITRDKAESFEDKSSGLNIRQFYRIDVAADHTVVAGSQDNGVSKYTEHEGWLDITGADGMEPIIDKFNTANIYSSIQYGNIYKTEDGGWTLSSAIAQTPGFGDWVTPLAQDPLVPNTLYQGKRHLYKSTDAGRSWIPISNFIMMNPLDTLMQEVDVFSKDGNYIVCGFAEEVFKTENGGISWQNITPDFEFANVNYISIHPHDKNWIAMALSGTEKRVVQTTDGGVTWQSIFGDLPDVGVECVLYEGGPKNGLYVSMNPGVYYKNSDIPEWQYISMKVPNVAVTELAIADCSLYASTFGRGLWKTDLIDNSPVYADNDSDGYGDPNNIVAYCEGALGYVYNADDCNDNNPDVSLQSDGTLWYIDTDGDGYGNPDTETESCDLLPLTVYVADNNDCNDLDNSIYPGQSEVCDGTDNNCDGVMDDLTTYYRDLDGDSYGNTEETIAACSLPSGYSEMAGDCNDKDATIHPGQTEFCDGIDNNCDGITEELTSYYRDTDADGYGSSTEILEACTQPLGYSLVAGDCDDDNASINPGQVEYCDGIDSNCDGVSEELETYYKDADGDGYGDDDLINEGCAQPAGYSLLGGDCNDEDASVYPGQTEICDGLDNDCNGLAEELITYYRDSDGDGFGNDGQTVEGCSLPIGYSLIAGDCNDGDASIHPDQEEDCDGLDNNCDGVAEQLSTFYRDADADGFGVGELTIEECDLPAGYSLVAGDCNDNDANIHPGQTELCDGIDSDCDGTPEELETYYRDVDGDGYGTSDQTTEGCALPLGYSIENGDCNDNDADIYPGQTEVCDGVDGNCDGVAEELETYFRDEDGDGYGIATDTQQGCAPPDGYVILEGDCDDADATIHPGQVEVCDGKDNNCDGISKELQFYYRDADNDGYGISEQKAQACNPPPGYTLLTGDCDDRDASINPGVAELCDELDNNCNNLIDENCEVVMPCDGVYIFIHNFTRDVFRAETRINSDAVLEVGDNKLLTAGEEVNLLPGFDVPISASLEIKIEPCMSSSSSQVSTEDQLNTDLKNIFDSSAPVKISVEDINGKVVFQQRVSLKTFGNDQQINLLPAGVYWMRVNNEEASSVNKILIVDND